MVFTWIDYQPSSYGDYNYPAWADVLGWMITMTSVAAIPVVAIFKIVTAEKKESFIEVSPFRLLVAVVNKRIDSGSIAIVYSS